METQAVNISCDFGYALNCLKNGKKIKRAHWGGYWFLSKDPVARQKLDNGYEESFAFKNGLIVAVLKDNGGCAPAQAYQEDMLAEDWEVVE
jgi:hypothetical protein